MDTNTKKFCIDLKKEIKDILLVGNESNDFAVVWDITKERIEFILMYSFPIDCYMSSIIQSLQKKFHIFGLEKEYSLKFHFNTEVILKCKFPFFSEIFTVKKNCNGFV